MTKRKEKRLTRAQEDRAHVYALAGTLGGGYIMACRLVELESLGRILRKRFENACNYEWASGEDTPYAKRTDKLVERAREVAHYLGVAKCEVNRDPRGAAIKLYVHTPGEPTTHTGREFYL